MTDIVRIELPTKRPYVAYAKYAPADWPEGKDYLEIAHILDTDKWCALAESDGGSHSSTTYNTEAEAEAFIMEHILFRRSFWDRYLEGANNGDKTPPDKLMRNKGGEQIVRIDGQHYVVGHEPSAEELRSNREHGGLGHGGREFKIRMHDGREIVTRNLWAQGKIPFEYREVLPDNAVFIQ